MYIRAKIVLGNGSVTKKQVDLCMNLSINNTENVFFCVISS